MLSGRRSVLPPAFDQLGRIVYHSLAVLQQPLRIPANKLYLMSAAFLIHRADIPDGMRFGHLGKKFIEELRLGYRAIEELISRKQHFVEHYVACVRQAIKGIPACLGELRSSVACKL